MTIFPTGLTSGSFFIDTLEINLLEFSSEVLCKIYIWAWVFFFVRIIEKSNGDRMDEEKGKS